MPHTRGADAGNGCHNGGDARWTLSTITKRATPRLALLFPEKCHRRWHRISGFPPARAPCMLCVRDTPT